MVVADRSCVFCFAQYILLEIALNSNECHAKSHWRLEGQHKEKALPTTPLLDESLIALEVGYCSKAKEIHTIKN